jgi:hypothetical protein
LSGFPDEFPDEGLAEEGVYEDWGVEALPKPEKPEDDPDAIVEAEIIEMRQGNVGCCSSEKSDYECRWMDG